MSFNQRQSVLLLQLQSVHEDTHRGICVLLTRSFCGGLKGKRSIQPLDSDHQLCGRTDFDHSVCDVPARAIHCLVSKINGELS